MEKKYICHRQTQRSLLDERVEVKWDVRERKKRRDRIGKVKTAEEVRRVAGWGGEKSSGEEVRREMEVKSEEARKGERERDKNGKGQSRRSGEVFDRWRCEEKKRRGNYIIQKGGDRWWRRNLRFESCILQSELLQTVGLADGVQNLIHHLRPLMKHRQHRTWTIRKLEVHLWEKGCRFHTVQFDDIALMSFLLSSLMMNYKWITTGIHTTR